MAKGKKTKDRPPNLAPTPSNNPAHLYPFGDGPPAPHGSPVPGESWYSHGGIPMNSPAQAGPSGLGTPMGGMTGAFPPLNIITTATQTVAEERAGDVPAATFGWGGTPNVMGGGSVMGGTPNIDSDWGKHASSSKDRGRKVKFGETSAAPSPASGAAWGQAPQGRWDRMPTSPVSASTESRWEDKYGQGEAPNEWGHFDQYQSPNRDTPPQPPHAAHFPPPQSHSSFANPRKAPRPPPPPPQPTPGPSKSPAWKSWGKENKPVPPPSTHSAPSIAPPSAISQNPSWKSWATEAQKLQKTSSTHSSVKPPPKLSDTIADLFNHGTPNTQNRYLGGLSKAQKEGLQRYAQEHGFRANPLLSAETEAQNHSHQGGWGSQPPSASWGPSSAPDGGWGANDAYYEDEDEDEDEDEGYEEVQDNWGHKGRGKGNTTAGWGAPSGRGHNDWGSTSDNRSRKSGKGDTWSAKGDNWDANGKVWKEDGWDSNGGWGDPPPEQKQDRGPKPKHGQYQGWGDDWNIEEEEEEDDDKYSSRSPHTPGKPQNPSVLASSVGFGTINGDSYPLPSKTLAHAYTLAGTPLPKSEELPTEIVETKGAGLAPAEHAFFDTKSRFARDRFHWMFPPHKDQRVADVLGKIQKMAYNIGVFGLRKFLQTRERGALLINASYMHPSPNTLALDWLTFDQLQQTRDKILQQSVIGYDPSMKTIVFIFLPSKTGKSVAIWRRKVVVPNNVRLMYQPELRTAVAGLRSKKEYVVHIDELPAPKVPEAPVITKSTKKSLRRKNSLKRTNSLRRDIPAGPDGKIAKKKKKSWWKRLFRL